MLVPSCSGSHDQTGPSRHTDQPVVTGEPAGDNAADVTFAEAVIALDQQAIDLASLVRNHSSNSELTSFAAAKASARQSEMQVAKVLLVQWNTNPDGLGPRSPKPMPAMVDQGAIAKLQSSHGGAFDTLWVQSMIGVDNASVEAAKAEVATGKNVDAVDMATQMSAGRLAEIDQLKKLA
jgi:uncharacterized protein (DUF305 family)